MVVGQSNHILRLSISLFLSLPLSLNHLLSLSFSLSPSLSLLLSLSFSLPLSLSLSLSLSLTGLRERELHPGILKYLVNDKLQLTGRNLGRVFNCRSDWMFVMHLFFYEAKQPNLLLKTRPKQLLGSLPLAFALPDLVH